MMGFKSFNRERRTLSGIKAMTVIRKGQVNEIDKRDCISSEVYRSNFGAIA
jgi:hypothetical protein